MQRRTFLTTTLAATSAMPLLAALRSQRWDDATSVLERATATNQVDSAVLHVAHGDDIVTRSFGNATSDALFLLGSISKPMNVAALMTLFDEGLFRLDDPVQKYLPAFRGEGRERVTVQHLLTHVSGLPDQLPMNNELRKRHAPLADFVEQAVRTAPSFTPGTRYQYSSMGILLASQIGALLSGLDMLSLVQRRLFRSLGMKRSAQGLETFSMADVIPCQMEGAAPESGGGDPDANEWDWNSAYWRKLGAPWGGTHSSAHDVARFLDEIMHARGRALRPETAALMVANHNAVGLKPRGLGFDVGAGAGCPGCSERTFGHTGSTGTLCWADPATQTICVVLTSLPRRATNNHPRDLAGERVAAAANR